MILELRSISFMDSDFERLLVILRKLYTAFPEMTVMQYIFTAIGYGSNTYYCTNAILADELGIFFRKRIGIYIKGKI